MDNWSDKEMLKMQLGGNKRFKDFLRKYKIQKPNYKEEELRNYRNQLQGEVDEKTKGNI